MHYDSYDLPSAVTEEGLANMVCASVKDYLGGVTDYVARCQQRVAELEEALGIVTDEKHALQRQVDEAWRPVGLTNAERGVLAFQLAVRLDIQNQWQVFSSLWGTTPGSLRSAHNKANEQRKTMSFIEKLNIILS